MSSYELTRWYKDTGRSTVVAISFSAPLIQRFDRLMLLEAVICFVRVFVQGFVDSYLLWRCFVLYLLDQWFRWSLGFWKRSYDSFEFLCRSLSICIFFGASVGVRAAGSARTLRSNFSCRSSLIHIFFGTFVGVWAAGSGHMIRSSFCAGSIVDAFIGVQLSMISSAFNCWCFCWHSIVGAFVGVQSSVLSSAFNRRCFCQRSIVGDFVGNQSSVAQAGWYLPKEIDLV